MNAEVCSYCEPCRTSRGSGTSDLGGDTATGGTWHSHQVHTATATNILALGVSQRSPVKDKDGIPRLLDTEGEPTTPAGFTNDHRHEITPLLPGHHYFFLALVADTLGNWDVLVAEFDTKRQTVSVKFTEITVYDDGDNLNHGEGEFWFDIYDAGKLAISFHQPTMDIDDWSGTGRPYVISFGPHVIGPRIVIPGMDRIGIFSHAVEHDGWFEVDDKAATMFGARGLPIPFGRSAEAVANQPFFVDCQPTSGSLHYSVKAEFSVAYS
jgi:hypothetical protein